jgi:hypothetical protein
MPQPVAYQPVPVAVAQPALPAVAPAATAPTVDSASLNAQKEQLAQKVMGEKLKIATIVDQRLDAIAQRPDNAATELAMLSHTLKKLDCHA